jgi:hypothetical protein
MVRHKHIARPEPNSPPEAAMGLGEQDSSSWEWSAREYGASEHRVSGPARQPRSRPARRLLRRFIASTSHHTSAEAADDGADP